MRHELAGVFQREGLDIDHLSRQSGGADRRLPLIDIIGTCRNEQHVHELGILLVRSDDLVVEADLLHRERDVLVGLNLDLAFQIPFGETGRHLDDFGDCGVAT